MGKFVKNLVILESEDASAIFSLAKSFFDTGKQIALRYPKRKRAGRESLMDTNIFAVAATNLSLSFELNFKGLALLVTGNYDPGHELSILFDKLPVNVKKDITQLFEKKKSMARGDMPIIRRLSPLPNARTEYDPWNSEITLEVFLNTHNNGFLEWRYHFQPEAQKPIYADFGLMLVFAKILQIVVKKYTALHLKVHQRAYE